MNNIVRMPEKQLTAVEVRTRVNLIQEVMRSVMKTDTHFGKIPGTDKPTLYKAGAEVLLTTFRIGMKIDVEDMSDGDSIRYRVKVTGIHQTTNDFVGEGVGECSTNEEKYKWRTAVCEEEFDDTQENRRRIKYGKKWNNNIRSYDVFKIKQIRTEPADLANTVLKMAKKRAMIDFTLTALGASDIFTQDIEDLPEELRGTATEAGGAPQGEPIEHEAMKDAKTPQDLSKIMNGLKSDERKKYLAYYQKRLGELNNGTTN